jgi:hypothetical protein
MSYRRRAAASSSSGTTAASAVPTAVAIGDGEPCFGAASARGRRRRAVGARVRQRSPFHGIAVARRMRACKLAGYCFPSYLVVCGEKSSRSEGAKGNGRAFASANTSQYARSQIEPASQRGRAGSCGPGRRLERRGGGGVPIDRSLRASRGTAERLHQKAKERKLQPRPGRRGASARDCAKRCACAWRPGGPRAASMATTPARDKSTPPAGRPPGGGIGERGRGRRAPLPCAMGWAGSSLGFRFGNQRCAASSEQIAPAGGRRRAALQPGAGGGARVGTGAGDGLGAALLPAWAPVRHRSGWRVRRDDDQQSRGRLGGGRAGKKDSLGHTGWRAGSAQRHSKGRLAPAGGRGRRPSKGGARSAAGKGGLGAWPAGSARAAGRPARGWGRAPPALARVARGGRNGPWGGQKVGRGRPGRVRILLRTHCAAALWG